MSAITKLGVVGAGTMGHGIAQVAAQAGCQVRLVDIAAEALERGLKQVEASLEKLVAKERITTEDAAAARGRIQAGKDLSQLADADLVVEAVVERFEVKRELLAALDENCDDATILASNTSSISITELGAATGRPDRVIGMHFMNPVPLMRLVEIIRGLGTSEATYATVEAATRSMGKTPVACNDAPGFVSNRVLLPMINEAVFCLFEGVADVRGIDAIMKLGMNDPMGPLALADLIGLDVCLDITRVLHGGFADSKYRPCPLLVRMVDAGYLGRKSGRGFYTYDEETQRTFEPGRGYV
jgi:3-hydroxybutyryl-CoA dehydrogenase